MARSTYVYIVTDYILGNATVPVAAFTVKREAQAWLKQAMENDHWGGQGLGVTRLSDNAQRVGYRYKSLMEFME